MALRLETFDGAGPEEAPVLEAEADEAQLAAFEQGYAAGWEDAAKTHAADQTRIGADLARSLQALDLTVEQARAQVLMALRPLIRQTLAGLLPAMARQALPRTIVDILSPHAAQLTQNPVALTLNPADRPAVEALCHGRDDFHLAITEEPTLAPGQAFLRFAEQEVLVDLSGAATEVATAIQTFFETEQRSA